ncbi:glycosyltransferase family 4 protein [Aquihabitans sp. McL0605]|uniref:glycosyltransferase family 4 protein n=1 Tax=Aquihabitans sp. McL0605 TaxID=3415671 RepID=UPI003CF14789
MSAQPDSTAPLRVSVDVTSLLHEATGVGVFTGALVAGLAERSDIDLSVFAVSWRGRDRLASAAPAGAAVRARPVPARLARAAWRRTDLPTARMLGGRSDVVHGPNFVVPPGGGATEVVTVHDLTALRYPEMCTADVLEWPGLLRRALRRGAWVHAVSRFVADEVREAFPEAADRVVAVPNGIRLPAPAGPTTDASAGHHLAGGLRYVLALGTVDPRKDLTTLVAAFDSLADEDPDLRLVIAGSDGMGAEALAAAIAASPARDRIVRLGRITDAARLALLRGASVVAYPSRYEGFGLVPLEAMAVGTPVVATAVGAVPEVVGDAALLVPEHDAPALAAALAQVLSDQALRETLADEGLERAAGLPWSATIDGLVALYRTASGR